MPTRMPERRCGAADQPRDFRGRGYRSADGRFQLHLGFRSFDIYTGLPAPELADDEYAMMVSLSHQSYLA